MLPDGVEETINGTSPLRTYMDINIHPLDARFPDEPIDIYHKYVARMRCTARPRDLEGNLHCRASRDQAGNKSVPS